MTAPVLAGLDTSPEFRAYSQLVARIRAKVVEYAARVWAANQGIGDIDVDRMVGQMVPAVTAGQLRIADLTSLYLAHATGSDPIPVSDAIILGGRGVPASLVYRRPIITTRTALAEGKSLAQALDAGGRRLQTIATTDLQMAKVRQANQSLLATDVVYYRRVPKGPTCALCLIASTRPYRTGDLAPIHPGCNCDVDVIPPGMNLNDIINPQLLESTHEQVRRLEGIADRGGRAVDYRKIIVTNNHGEMGPTLGWRDQKFTGPDDLFARRLEPAKPKPKPKPKRVDAYASYDKERKKLLRQRDRRLSKLERDLDAERDKLLKKWQAQEDVISLAGDRSGGTSREDARKVLDASKTRNVFTDRDAPPGPTSWVDRPEKSERVAALDARIPEMRDNRLQRLSEIPGGTLTEGRRWYPDEGSFGRNIAIDAGLDHPIYGTGTGAAFSVRTDIEINRRQQKQFLGMPADRRSKAKQTDLTPKIMKSNLERGKLVLDAPPTREGILEALQTKSPSPKLSNYFPALEGDRKAHTADTWDGRIGDHSAAAIREALGLAPGTRLTDSQEAYGEKLLNIEEFGYHWTWNKKKGQWEPKPNYTAADKIDDNYEAFKRSNELAAAAAPPWHGTYTSVYSEADGRYHTVQIDDHETPWDVRDLQAALWIHVRNGSGD